MPGEKGGSFLPTNKQDEPLSSLPESQKFSPDV
jgi:hypothetical protein